MSVCAYVAEVRRRIDEGDMRSVAKGALEAVDANYGYRDESWEAVLDLLLGLGFEERRGLSDALVECYHSYGQDPITQRNALTLVSAVSDDFPDEPLATERLRELDELGQVNHCYWWGSRIDLLANAEVGRGRALAPAVVAFFRRSALSGNGSHPVPRGIEHPVLNVGEQWAERAMDSVEGAEGEAWRELLSHLTTTTATATTAAPKPTLKWDKQARSLIDALGADRVRDTVLPRLALVGRPRTFALEGYPFDADINGAYDRYNANALRGLAWLVSLLPPDPDTARALGALVETSLEKVARIGPRSPRVANAGVVALARIDSEAALAELARLSARVTYKSTLKLLDTALEASATRTRSTSARAAS